MESSRCISKVVEAIKTVTPESFVDKRQYHKGLDEVVESARYTSPEMMYVRWDQLSTRLGIMLGKADTPWKMTVANIISAKINYKDFL